VHAWAVNTCEVNGRRHTNGIISDISERKRMEQELACQATHDLLTGLPNRRDARHEELGQRPVPGVHDSDGRTVNTA